MVTCSLLILEVTYSLSIEVPLLMLTRWLESCCTLSPVITRSLTVGCYGGKSKVPYPPMNFSPKASQCPAESGDWEHCHETSRNMSQRLKLARTSHCCSYGCLLTVAEKPYPADRKAPLPAAAPEWIQICFLTPVDKSNFIYTDLKTSAHGLGPWHSSPTTREKAIGWLSFTRGSFRWST